MNYHCSVKSKRAGIGRDTTYMYMYSKFLLVRVQGLSGERFLRRKKRRRGKGRKETVEVEEEEEKEGKEEVLQKFGS